MICPDCGHENRVGLLICDNCSTDLYDGLLEQLSTKQLERTKTRDLKIDELPSSRPVLLYVNADMALAIERRDEQIVGRDDPNGTDPVDVDLTPFAAHDFGVSRKHVRINASDLPLTIVDLGSYNGTFVNGQKLIPEQAFQIDSGDEVRLGRLVTRIYYK